MGWVAARLLKATNDSKYKSDFDKRWAEFNLRGRQKEFGWDDKTAGFQVLMAKITGDNQYKSAVEAYSSFLVNTAPKSPKGMVYLNQWGHFDTRPILHLFAYRSVNISNK